MRETEKYTSQVRVAAAQHKQLSHSEINLTVKLKEILDNLSHLSINDSREGQVVEYLSAVSPDSD